MLRDDLKTILDRQHAEATISTRRNVVNTVMAPHEDRAVEPTVEHIEPAGVESSSPLEPRSPAAPEAPLPAPTKTEYAPEQSVLQEPEREDAPESPPAHVPDREAVEPEQPPLGPAGGVDEAPEFRQPEAAEVPEAEGIPPESGAKSASWPTQSVAMEEPGPREVPQSDGFVRQHVEEARPAPPMEIKEAEPVQWGVMDEDEWTKRVAADLSEMVGDQMEGLRVRLTTEFQEQLQRTVDELNARNA